MSGRRAGRVVLREPTLDDEDEWIARMRASRRFHRPWIQMPATAPAFRAYIARQAGDP
jgi:[ribosomal protein S5]-alanine N-acetyltransferase